MPCDYKQKTTRASTPLDVINQAVRDVLSNKESLRNAAKVFKIDRFTLGRYVRKERESGQENEHCGYENVSTAKRIFDDQKEQDLSSHIKALAAQFHGIGEDQFAIKNNVRVPTSWNRNKKAGTIIIFIYINFYFIIHIII